MEAARVAGAEFADIKGAMEIGEMVREKPKEHMNALINTIMIDHHKGSDCCSSGG